VLRLADFTNTNVTFIVGKVLNDVPQDHVYVMIAMQGLQRISLGGTKDNMRRFLEKALAALVEH
jgi:hypothetical protein